jgi:Intron-binding protein aquarius N-terminus
MVFPKNKAATTTKGGGNAAARGAARGKRTRNSTGAAETAAVEAPKKAKIQHPLESTVTIPTEPSNNTNGTVIQNSSSDSSGNTLMITTTVTDEMRMVVNEWYHKWVVVVTMEGDHRGGVSSSSNSRDMVEVREDPYETLRTVVWPVFCDMVVPVAQLPPPPDNVATTLSLAQVALLIGYLLLQSSLSSSSSSYHPTSPNSLMLDFLHSCRTTRSDSSTWSTCWKVWCQSLFQYDQTAKEGWYREASVRIHCLNLIWTALSQQNYYYNHDDHDPEDGSMRDMMMMMMTTIGQSSSYISTATIHLYMPPRYRECHVRRRHPQRPLDGPSPPTPNDDDATITTTTPSFLVRTIQLLLEVLESPPVLVIPDRAAASESHISAVDDTDPPDTTIDRNATTWTEPWKFLHVGLEFIGNLLSTPCIPQQQVTTTTTPLFDREPIIEYLISIHFMIRATRGYHRVLAASHSQPKNRYLVLTQQLLHRLSKWIYSFPMTNDAMSPHQPNADHTRAMYHHRATIFQKFCHRYYSTQLADIIYAGPGLLCQNGTHSGLGECGTGTPPRPSSFLRQALEGLNNEELYTLLYKMRLVDDVPPAASTETLVDGDHSSAAHLTVLYSDRSFLLAVLEEYLVVPNDPLKELQTYPLYPTEAMLWDFTQIPSSRNIQMEAADEQPTVLSVPKLSTRYLNFIDYLGRNFELVRYESAYEIRLDLIDAIRRVQPVVRHTTQPAIGSEHSASTPVKTVFTGWARMALELKGVFEIKQVNQPLLGELYPSQVVAEFMIDLKLCNNTIRQEWDDLGEYDILFLIAIDASKMQSPSRNEGRSVVPDEDDPTFPQRFGVTLVRGCMILQVRDDAGTVLSNFSSDISSQATRPSGTKRIFRVALDPTQYSLDRRASTTGMTDIYNTFNLVVRRSGKVNNFKAVLETIRGLMVGVGSIDRVIPTWLQSAILGYGLDPTYQSDTMKAYAKSTIGVPNPDAFLDYGDTFVDEQHLRSSFTELSDNIVVDGRSTVADDTNNDANDALSPTYYRVRVIESSDGDSQTRAVEAVSYQYHRRNSSKVRQGNSMRFTPRQVAAIRSGLSPGLSLIVGPPGSK